MEPKGIHMNPYGIHKNPYQSIGIHRINGFMDSIWIPMDSIWIDMILYNDDMIQYCMNYVWGEWWLDGCWRVSEWVSESNPHHPAPTLHHHSSNPYILSCNVFSYNIYWWWNLRIVYHWCNMILIYWYIQEFIGIHRKSYESIWNPYESIWNPWIHMEPIGTHRNP